MCISHLYVPLCEWRRVRGLCQLFLNSITMILNTCECCNPDLVIRGAQFVQVWSGVKQRYTCRRQAPANVCSFGTVSCKFDVKRVCDCIYVLVVIDYLHFHVSLSGRTCRDSWSLRALLPGAHWDAVVPRVMNLTFAGTRNWPLHPMLSTLQEVLHKTPSGLLRLFSHHYCEQHDIVTFFGPRHRVLHVFWVALYLEVLLLVQSIFNTR